MTISSTDDSDRSDDAASDHDALEADQSALAANQGFANQRVAFIGKLGGVSRREAHRLIRSQGGQPVERCELPLDVVICGAEELPLDNPAQSLDGSIRAAVDRGEVMLLSETQFWQRLGLVDNEPQVRRLYTPAMLAQLLNVPISIIRRWHRRGLIVPEREVHRLPYFDFQEVATARRLAELLAAGDSPETIENKLAALAKRMPGVDRPLAQLSVIIEGRQLLLRQGEGLIEPGGQRRLDFDSQRWHEDKPDSAAHESTARESEDRAARPATLPMSWVLSQRTDEIPTVEKMLAEARNLEDDGQIEEAIEMYRAALLAGGPNPSICFQLAELLYLTGETAAARERYAMAIELDDDYVEARANLGCVLIELGQPELAIAAFQGALSSHPDYPDVHYHLARALDAQGLASQAEPHWRHFLWLAPDSPWADEASLRLGEPSTASETLDDEVFEG